MTGGQYKRLRLLQKNPEKATTLETAALEAARGRKQRRSLQIGDDARSTFAGPRALARSIR